MEERAGPAKIDGAVDAALREVLHPGQQIVVGQAWGTPDRLLAGLARNPDLIAGSRIFIGMLVGALPPLPGAQVETFFPSGPLGSEEGLASFGATYTPCSLYELAADLRSGRRPVDVALVQAGAARDGRRSLGVSVDFAQPAAAAATVVVAEVGDAVPWTGPSSTLDAATIRAVDVGAAPGILSRSAGRRDEEIAGRVAALIPDGATLQLGMASWVDPLVSTLGERRGLRVHSGLISDWACALDAEGALDRAAPVVATGVAGCRELYVWIDEAGRVDVRPADLTHDPTVLADLPALRAVNSVFEVDLAGNVNCEVGPAGRRGGVAGLRDFAGAASSVDDAISIVALSATGRGGSKIVPELTSDRPSLPEKSVDVVVTEFGTADLRGLDQERRAAAMVAVAAPQYREHLASMVEAGA